MKKTKLRTRRDIEEFQSGLNPQKLYIDQYGEIWHGDNLAEAIAENAKYGYAKFYNKRYEERDYIVWYVVMYEKGKRTGQATTSLKMAKEMLSEIIEEYPKAHIIKEKQYATAEAENRKKSEKPKQKKADFADCEPKTHCPISKDCEISDICEESAYREIKNLEEAIRHIEKAQKSLEAVEKNTMEQKNDIMALLRVAELLTMDMIEEI